MISFLKLAIFVELIDRDTEEIATKIERGDDKTKRFDYCTYTMACKI